MKTSRFAGMMAACALALNLTACGGGGGGGGDSTGNSPAPIAADEPNSYFPTSNLLSWSYLAPPSASPLALSFAADNTASGQHIHALQYPTGGKEYYVTSANQIKLKGMYLPQFSVNGATFTADVIFNDAKPIWDANWAPAQPQPFNGSGTVNISPTYGQKPLTYSGTATFVTNGVLTTPVGQFAAKQLSVNITMSTTVDGVTFNIPYNVSFWVAENIGILSRSQGGTTYALISVSGPDRDHDGVFDGLDKFPDDAAESKDTDHDGIGDNADTDDDGDGVADNIDAFPLNSAESLDTDSDGLGNNDDGDDDNDGASDAYDSFPLNAQRIAPMSAPQNLLAFPGVFGSSEQPAARQIVISGHNARWTAATSANWIQLDKSQGNDADIVAVSIDTTNLDVGNTTGAVTFTDLDSGAQIVVPIGVTLALPEISASRASINFDASLGWGSIAPLQVELSLNTGNNSYTLSSTVSLANASAINVVASTGISSSPDSVTVGIDPSRMKGGNHTGAINFSVIIRGQTISKSVPLSVLASEHILYADKTGVSFSQFPGFASLSASIPVHDSYGLATSWLATTNQPWLSVTPSGSSGSSLTIQAMPSGLTPNTLHSAMVTITSSNGSIENTEQIKVGLWIGDTNPPITASVPVIYRYIQSDPVRPYVYVHNNDSGPIDIYNIYTHTFVNSISNVSSYALNDMAISNDGKYLYVRALQDYSGQPSIVRINLDDTQQRVSFPIAGSGLTIARPLGHEVIISDSGYAYDALSGSELGSLRNNYYGYVTINFLKTSANGQSWCFQTLGQSPANAGCFQLLYSSVASNRVQNLSGGSVPFNSINTGVLDVNGDGTLMYASDYAGFISVFSTTAETYVPIASIAVASTTALNVQTLNDGGIIAGFNGSGTNRLVRYSANRVAGNIVDLTTHAEFQRARSMVISSDGTMGALLTIGNTSSPLVFFRMP